MCYIIGILELMPCYSPTSLSKLKENFKNLKQVNINFDPLPSLLYDFHPIEEIEFVTNLIRLTTLTYFDKETNRRLIQRNRSLNVLESYSVKNPYSTICMLSLDKIFNLRGQTKKNIAGLIISLQHFFNCLKYWSLKHVSILIHI